VYSSTNSLTFPVTWGKGDEGSGADYRTFIIKAQDSLGNISSNEITKSIQIDAPSSISVAHDFTTRTEGTKVDARVYWTAPTIGSSQLPIDHYKVFYQDYTTGGSAPTFSNAGSAYLGGLGTTEFKQEVEWGPSITNTVNAITSTSGTSDDIRRYWVVPVDIAGNWGIAYSNTESDYIPEVEDVTVVRPNGIVGLTTSNYSTKSSNGVVEINWDLPTVTTAPITSIRVFWEIPTWLTSTNSLTSTRLEKNSKAGTATKYSTPVTRAKPEPKTGDILNLSYAGTNTCKGLAILDNCLTSSSLSFALFKISTIDSILSKLCLNSSISIFCDA
jgi:hypothetical protein